MKFYKHNKKKEKLILGQTRRSRSSETIPTAFSYHARRAEGTTYPPKGRASSSQASDSFISKLGHMKHRRLILGVCLIVVGTVLVAGLRVSTNAQVTLIQPTGFSYQPHSIAQYSTAVDKTIKASIYNQFKLTLSSYAIANRLKAKFPEVQYVTITVPIVGATPSVDIQLAKPALIYNTVHGNYLLNNQGIVIDNSSILGAKQLAVVPTIQSSTGSTYSIGQQILTAQYLLFIKTITLSFKAKAVAINKMVLVPGAEELDVYPLGVPYYVKFNLHQTDALQQVGTYFATIATLKGENKTASQYIDVRVDGRAYYK